MYTTFITEPDGITDPDGASNSARPPKRLSADQVRAIDGADDGKPSGWRRATTFLIAIVIGVSSWAVYGHVSAPKVVTPSPSEIVSSFLADRIAGSWEVACSYFPPATAAGTECLGEVGSSDLGLTYKGSVRVTGAVADHNRALVALTGNLCVSDSRYKGLARCVSSTASHSGMPGAQVSFATAYQRAVSKANRALSPWPCERVGGQWYLTPAAG